MNLKKRCSDSFWNMGTSVPLTIGHSPRVMRAKDWSMY